MDKLKAKRRSEIWLRPFLLVALALATIVALGLASNFTLAFQEQPFRSQATVTA